MHGYGGVEQLFYEEVDEPRLIEPDDVIVKLKAAAINHIDIWNRMGATGIVVPMPHILGADGAGVVVEVGAKVANVKVGDLVCLYPPTGCGQCEFCLTDRDFMCFRLRVLGERMEGTYAQYVKLPAQNCFPIPQNYSFEEAAAFPLVFITLWRMLITNAEQLRKHSGNALEAATEAASLRLRPILMTSIAMIAGMIPMATGHGEGGGQVAPLARAVIGGLFASTMTALFILPLVFSWIQGKTSTASVSLDPEDKESKYYVMSAT